MMKTPIGIYEKALPHSMTWEQKLQITKELNFDFIEMSIDETDHRLERLDWSKEQCLQIYQWSVMVGIPIRSICLSGHRRYPLGSEDETTRTKALTIMEKALQLATCLGVRVIQLAGYDVYYEPKNERTKAHFIAGLEAVATMAAKYQVMLAIEIMDDPFMSSITKYQDITQTIRSPWLKVYPDVGNLSAWQPVDVAQQLQLGIEDIVAIHLKDTRAVSKTCKGQFRDVVFGEGCVDFLAVFKQLFALGYQGPFLIEMWSETANSFRTDIAAAQAYLLPKLREAGFRC